MSISGGKSQPSASEAIEKLKPKPIKSMPTRGDKLKLNSKDKLKFGYESKNKVERNLYVYDHFFRNVWYDDKLSKVKKAVIEFVNNKKDLSYKLDSDKLPPLNEEMMANIDYMMDCFYKESDKNDNEAHICGVGMNKFLDTFMKSYDYG
jgi:hypothetical protein